MSNCQTLTPDTLGQQLFTFLNRAWPWRMSDLVILIGTVSIITLRLQNKWIIKFLLTLKFPQTKPKWGGINFVKILLAKLNLYPTQAFQEFLPYKQNAEIVQP